MSLSRRPQTPKYRTARGADAKVFVKAVAVRTHLLANVGWYRKVYPIRLAQ